MRHYLHIDSVEHIQIGNVQQAPENEFSEHPTYSVEIRILTTVGETSLTLTSYRDPLRMEFDISR